MPGVSLKVLQQMDGPMPGYATIIVELEVAAGTMVGRHSHPGIETTYVVEGYAELLVDDQPSRVVRAGEAFQVPPHLKRILRLDRLRLRGPNGARDEFLLAATAQNLRKLAKLIPVPSTHPA